MKGRQAGASGLRPVTKAHPPTQSSILWAASGPRAMGKGTCGSAVSVHRHAWTHVCAYTQSLTVRSAIISVFNYLTF